MKLYIELPALLNVLLNFPQRGARGPIQPRRSAGDPVPIREGELVLPSAAGRQPPDLGWQRPSSDGSGALAHLFWTGYPPDPKHL